MNAAPPTDVVLRLTAEGKGATEIGRIFDVSRNRIRHIIWQAKAAAFDEAVAAGKLPPLNGKSDVRVR